MSFPSDMKRSTTMMEWRDVPLYKWYEIVNKELIDGNALILTLEDEDGNRLITFATSVIHHELRKRPECNYIRSVNEEYYDFDLVSY